MCTSPIIIRNPKKDFNKFTDKPFLVVPCGKCVECQEQKKMSYEVRSFYEYLWHSEHGGMTYYYTLTYNNFHIPHFDLPQKFSSVTRRITCFNRDHIKRLVERLRSVFPELSFLVTSEYGGRTRRPHYHVLFHIPVKYDPYRFYKLVSDCWHYNGKSLGYVQPGNDLGVVNSPSANKYVVKYVCKDDSYFDVLKMFNDAFNSSIYFDLTKYNPKTGVIDDGHYMNRLKLVTPFVYKSMSYGKHAFDYANQISENLGSIALPYLSKNVPLPLYYFRKLYYSTEKDDNNNTRYILNEKGISHKIEIFNSLIDKRISKLKSLDNPCELSKDFQAILFYHSNLHFKSLKSIYDYVISSCNIRDLFIYDYVYKDRIATSAVSFIPEKDMKLMFAPFVMPFSDYRQVDEKDMLTFNQLSFFKDYDFYLSLIKLCNIYLSYQRYVKKIEKQNSCSRLKRMSFPDGEAKCHVTKVKTIYEFSNLFKDAQSSPSFSS